MRISISRLAVSALATSLGIGCPETLAAGVDAKSVVDAKVKCAFPAILAKAVREHARQELKREMKERGVETIEAPSDYRWCAVDLNDDGRLEVIYQSGFCGMGGCPGQVLAWRGAKLAPIGIIDVSHDGAMIGKRRHRGWRDLYVYGKGSASSFSIPVYTFRGDAYRSAGIPLLLSELNDRLVDPDRVTINRDRNEFRIGENIPEEEHEKRLQGHRGWHPSHWVGSDPGYRDEAYERGN